MSEAVSRVSAQKKEKNAETRLEAIDVVINFNQISQNILITLHGKTVLYHLIVP